MTTASVPNHVEGIWCAPDGSIVRIRPIEAADATFIHEFVASLSSETRYLRFMAPVKQLSSYVLDRLTRVDERRDAALVAIVIADGDDRVVGVARYAGNADVESCDFAIVVADDWRRRGLGSFLLTLLIDTACARGLKRMGGDVLAINGPMTAFAKAHGFSVSRSRDEPTCLRVERRLDGAPSVRPTNAASPCRGTEVSSRPLRKIHRKL
jgi:acetyltransferase